MTTKDNTKQEPSEAAPATQARPDKIIRLKRNILLGKFRHPAGYVMSVPAAVAEELAKNSDAEILGIA